MQLSGKDQNGAWKTTRAKAYPSRLNAALVESVFHEALENFAIQPDDEFQAAVAKIVAAQEISGQTIGPDYVQWIYYLQGVKVHPTSAPKGKKVDGWIEAIFLATDLTSRRLGWVVTPKRCSDFSRESDPQNDRNIQVKDLS